MFPLVALLTQLIAAQSNGTLTGNCLTGRYRFDRNRIFVGTPPASGVDPSLYDFIADYGLTTGNAPNIEFTSSGVSLNLVKGTPTASGARISTTRYIQYARLTARFSAIAVPGVVTTFITMSGRKDELDVEIVGGDTQNYQSNVFYKGIEERGVHGGVHPVAGGVAKVHEYTMDWNSKRVVWSVDNRTSRTYNNDANAVSAATPRGERWYPTTPSQVQISVWDFGGGDWAGGPIPWGSRSKLTAAYEWIDIQCYNDKDEPVAKWPPNSPDRRENNGSGNGNRNGDGSGGKGNGSGSENDTGNSGFSALPSLGLMALSSIAVLIL